VEKKPVAKKVVSKKVSKGKAAKKAKKIVKKKVEKKPALPQKKPRKKGSLFTDLFHSKERKNTGIGFDQPRRDVTRFVKWPRYVRIQRQRKILMLRLRIPPPIYQFSRAWDRNNAMSFFKLASKYRLESKRQRRSRLLRWAKVRATHPAENTHFIKPLTLVAGLNAVTRALEKKKAQLVVIAHDANPLELVVWLPALCRKLEVPYAIIKGKSRLGHLTNTKTSLAVAFTKVHKEDQDLLTRLAKAAKEHFNENADLRRQWGGATLGAKSLHKLKKQQALIAEEEEKKAAAALVAKKEKAQKKAKKEIAKKDRKEAKKVAKPAGKAGEKKPAAKPAAAAKPKGEEKKPAKKA